MSKVLILGSGPSVIRCRDWSLAHFDRIVVINNAWAVRPDWDDLIHPEDFPVDRRPKDIKPGQTIVTAQDYVPIQNTYGGFVYAGGTMAFTAGYWALGALRPKVLAFLGCDMVYPDTAATHFYGTGQPDPLRRDVTLRNLEAKSARLMILGAQQNCAMVNLSVNESRLVFPKAEHTALDGVQPQSFDQIAAATALREEEKLGYLVPSGRYWEDEDRFDTTKIDALDQRWLTAARLT